MMNSVNLAICGFFSAVVVWGGAVSCHSASRISLRGHDCQGAVIESIQCDLLPNDKVWILEQCDRPQLAPKKALNIALEAAGALDFGPLGGDVTHRAIRLIPCGEGWIYLIELTVTLDCGEEAEFETRPVVIAVLMNGESIVPSRSSVPGETELTK